MSAVTSTQFGRTAYTPRSRPTAVPFRAGQVEWETGRKLISTRQPPASAYASVGVSVGETGECTFSQRIIQQRADSLRIQPMG